MTAAVPQRRWQRLADMAARLHSAPATAPVPSPCQSVCVMHAQTGHCEGCLRSLAEIAAWSRMDDTAKREVWAQLPARLAQRQALESAP